MADEFAGGVEAGQKPRINPVVKQTISILEDIDLTKFRIADDPRYKAIVSECSQVHKQLLDNKDSHFVENPALIGEYLGKLRLNANRLFAFLNVYIETLSSLEMAYATKRQNIYEDKLREPKGSPSSAQNHARESTLVDAAKIKNIENNIQQIKNEYERYNGICMYLQSRMKEFNTERMIG